jgi:hypothetical protein
MLFRIGADERAKDGLPPCFQPRSHDVDAGAPR